jgi:hypothetical protein
VAALEFGVPRGVWRLPWEAWVRLALPAAGLVIGSGWFAVGRFLGGSIREFRQTYPLARQLALWREAGIADVQARPLSLGGGVVTWGRRR